MLETEGGKLRMPRQEVKEDQVHGYVGEKEGLVEVYEPVGQGSTNAVPDVESAQRRVDALTANLEQAKAVLKAAQAGKVAAAPGAAAPAKSQDKGEDKQRAPGDNK